VEEQTSIDGDYWEQVSRPYTWPPTNATQLRVSTRLTVYTVLSTVVSPRHPDPSSDPLRWVGFSCSSELTTAASVHGWT